MTEKGGTCGAGKVEQDVPQGRNMRGALGLRELLNVNDQKNYSIHDLRYL